MKKGIGVVLLVVTTLSSVGCAGMLGVTRQDPTQISFAEQQTLFNKLRHESPELASQSGQSPAVAQRVTAPNGDDPAQPALSDQARLKIYLDLVQGMMDKKLFYAAIAHLD